MWTSVDLIIAQKTSSLTMKLDLKVDKSMTWRELKLLLQKIVIKMWNECVGIFKNSRSKKIKLSSKLYKFASQKINKKLDDLTALDIQLC